RAFARRRADGAGVGAGRAVRRGLAAAAGAFAVRQAGVLGVGAADARQRARHGRIARVLVVGTADAHERIRVARSGIRLALTVPLARRTSGRTVTAPATIDWGLTGVAGRRRHAAAARALRIAAARAGARRALRIDRTRRAGVRAARAARGARHHVSAA